VGGGLSLPGLCPPDVVLGLVVACDASLGLVVACEACADAGREDGLCGTA